MLIGPLSGIKIQAGPTPAFECLTCLFVELPGIEPGSYAVLRASPCAVRYVSTWISESREQARMTIPVTV